MKARLSNEDLKKEIYYGSDLYPVMQSIFMREARIRRVQEHFWVASLNNKGRLLNVELVNIGATNRIAVQPPEVFRIAIYKAAVSIILVHNPATKSGGRHPSGVLKPSHEDRHQTDRFMKVGKLLSIKVEDHLIISETDCYSMQANGVLDELRKSGLYEVTLKETEEMRKWREEELAKQAKQAKEDERRVMAAKMLAKNEPIDKVVEYTGLRKSSVEKMVRLAPTFGKGEMG
jgi:DNA repair protein RadC